jgi:hypothetical protein
MIIGIDISQMAYENTGVANYLRNLVEHLLEVDQTNEYVLFYSSLRRTMEPFDFAQGGKTNVIIKKFRFPPALLDFLWNKVHIMAVESLIGDIDVFISSDWTQPPTKHAKRVTILYDLVVYKYPEETAKKIVDTQRRRLKWVKKECDAVLCISEATKRDAIEILEIPDSKLHVISAGA